MLALGLTFARERSPSARSELHVSRDHLHIEHLRIRNFKAFQDARMDNIPSVCLLVGKNGTGKSTLFEVFSFLKDALVTNVTKALNRRGGFSEVVTRGQNGPIEFEVKFRESGGRLATYSLKIGAEGPRGVLSEVLKFRRGNRGQPWAFLNFCTGQGHGHCQRGKLWR